MESFDQIDPAKGCNFHNVSGKNQNLENYRWVLRNSRDFDGLKEAGFSSTAFGGSPKVTSKHGNMSCGDHLIVVTETERTHNFIKGELCNHRQKDSEIPFTFQLRKDVQLREDEAACAELTIWPNTEKQHVAQFVRPQTDSFAMKVVKQQKSEYANLYMKNDTVSYRVIIVDNNASPRFVCDHFAEILHKLVCSVEAEAKKVKPAIWRHQVRLEWIKGDNYLLRAHCAKKIMDKYLHMMREGKLIISFEQAKKDLEKRKVKVAQEKFSCMDVIVMGKPQISEEYFEDLEKIRSIRPWHLTLRIGQISRKDMDFFLQGSKSNKSRSSDFALDALFVLQENGKKEKYKPFEGIFEIETSFFGWTFLVFSGEYWHIATITTLKHIAKSAKLVIVISVPAGFRHKNLVNALVLGVDDRNFACAWNIPRVKKKADHKLNAPIKDPYSPLRGKDVLPHEIKDTLVELQKSDGLHKVRLAVFKSDFLFGPEDGPRLPWKDALLVMKNSADAYEVKQGKSTLIPANKQVPDNDFEHDLSTVPVHSFAQSPDLDEPPRCASPEPDWQTLLPQLDHGLKSDWFDFLEQSVKDEIVTFVTQSTHHYGGEFSPHVIADMKAKFGLEDYQIAQLPSIVYDAQAPLVSASFPAVMQVEDDGFEDLISSGKTNQDNREADFQKKKEGKASFSLHPVHGSPSGKPYQHPYKARVDEHFYIEVDEHCYIDPKKRKANFQGEPNKKQKIEEHDLLADD